MFSHGSNLMQPIALIILLALISPQPGRARSLPLGLAVSRTQAGPKKRSEPVAGAAPVTVSPIAKSALAQPLKRSWQYLTDRTVALPAALDSNQVYLPLASGRTVSLDRESGSLLWASDQGGVISVPIAIGEDAAYIATHRLAEDGSEAGASLRAVDKVTGLTLWAHDYARPFTSQPVPSRDRIYVGSADGAFYALSSAGGEVIWRVQTEDVVRGAALVGERLIYFGSDDGGLRAVDRETGRELWKYQTGGRVTGRPCAGDHSIYFGSGDGFVYSVDLATGKLRWRARTGAAVEAPPVVVQDRVIVGSFDNFVYCFACANGNRIWKRRFDNRIAAAVIVEGDSVLIAPLRSNHVAVLLTSSGQLASYYKLDAEYEIVAPPSFDGRTLVLPADKGLVAVVASPTTTPPPNAVKQ